MASVEGPWKSQIHAEGSRTIHRYRPLPPDSRPRDATLDGRTLTYEALEHGGEYCMPLVIRVTEADGRNCICLPITEHGEIVDSLGFALECEK